MATRKLVHKQFNSPIGLYSNQNVQETLDRELKTLNNGAVGIDFDDPSTTRTGNLAKSAVLAALEEEEREKQGRKSGLIRVAWPPNLDGTSPAPSATGANIAVGVQPVSQPPVQVQNKEVEVQPFAVNQKVASPQQPRPELVFGGNNVQSQHFAKPLSPLPQLDAAPVAQQHGPIYASPRGWNHVNPPKSGGSHFSNVPAAAAYGQVAPSYGAQDSTGHYFQQQHQNVYPQSGANSEVTHHVIAPASNLPQHVQAPTSNVQQHVPAPTNNLQQHVQAPASNLQQPFRGSPLRKEAPLTASAEKPAPTYVSQPVASSFQGGVNRRGDSKWPPSEYKQQSEIDNAARRQLALGPVFRPKRVNKDYSGFFAQNALSNTYPGYRIPPVLQNMH